MFAKRTRKESAPADLQLGPHERRDLGPEALDRAHDGAVVDLAGGHLREVALVAEELVLEQDLLRHLLRAPGGQRSARRAQRHVLLRRHRRPATLAADPAHHGHVVRREVVPVVAHEGMRVDGHRQVVVAGLGRRPAVELDQRHEALGLAADDRQRQRQAERAGAHHGGRRAADRDPHRQRVLDRARVHAGVIQRRPVASRPRDPLARSDPQQQLELGGEQLVVVLEVVAEKRERLGERPAAGPDLGAPAGQQVDRRKLLEDPHRIVGAEHRDRAREPDPLRLRGGRREYDGGRGDGEVGPVVLADPEHVETQLVGQPELLHQVAQALLRPDGRSDVREGDESELHGKDNACVAIRATPGWRTRPPASAI